MRRNNKKRLIPLALALVLAMVGAALAVPLISVSVQKVGGGSNSSVTIDTTSAAVNWDFDTTRQWIITGAEISLDQGPGVDGTLDLYITLDDGTLVQASSSVTASSTSVSVSGLNIDLTQNYITDVVVVIEGQQVTT
jgi:hypothetical protein